MTRLVVIDNYDSFTYNLVQYASEAGADPVVFRNDAVSAEAVLERQPEAILISPGPATPHAAGVSVPLVRLAAGHVPLLGVCLGHQAIAAAYGGKVVRAERPVHGHAAAIRHDGTALFAGVPSPFRGMRYHSLVVLPSELPACLEVTAWSADAVAPTHIMALRHREYPVFGVQFHPESIGTDHGLALLANFLAIAASFRLGAAV